MYRPIFTLVLCIRHLLEICLFRCEFIYPGGAHGEGPCGVGKEKPWDKRSASLKFTVQRLLRWGGRMLRHIRDYHRKFAWLSKDKMRHFRRLLWISDPDPRVLLGWKACKVVLELATRNPRGCLNKVRDHNEGGMLEQWAYQTHLAALQKVHIPKLHFRPIDLWGYIFSKLHRRWFWAQLDFRTAAF